VGVIAAVMAIPTTAERALADAEQRANSWAVAQFTYFDEHGGFTTSEEGLLERGADPLQPQESVLVYVANGDAFCIDALMRYVDDDGPATLKLALYRKANDLTGRYWTSARTCRGVVNEERGMSPPVVEPSGSASLEDFVGTYVDRKTKLVLSITPQRAVQVERHPVPDTVLPTRSPVTHPHEGGRARQRRSLGWRAAPYNQHCGTTDPSCGVLLRAEPQASVTATSTAPPSFDSEGRKVTYQAQYAYDGDPETAWRTAGDGRGERLILTFDGPTHLTRIGIVNGYDKTDPGPEGTYWYPENRRIIEVRYVFDDGSSIIQHLVDDKSRAVGFQGFPVVGFQGVPVEVTTSTVTIEILKTTEPGSRDYTAISEMAFLTS
jgi:hypothetical protein